MSRAAWRQISIESRRHEARERTALFGDLDAIAVDQYGTVIAQGPQRIERIGKLSANFKLRLRRNRGQIHKIKVIGSDSNYE